MSDENIRKGESNPLGTIHGNPDSGIKFMGKAPPAFFKALKEVKGENAETKEEKRIIEEGKQPKRQPRVAGSSQLESLLQRLGEQNYVYEEIILPSRGIFYDGTDGPTDGKLDVRPMTGEEEQILATPRFLKRGKAVDMIFQRCTKQNFKPEEFLAIDRIYLLIYLRGISYGNKYDVEIKCGECSKKFNHTIDLGSLMVDACPDTIRPPLTEVLPKSQCRFTWRLPRGKDENLVNDHRERNFKQFGESGADDSLLYKISLMIDEIEGITHKTEILVLLKRLPIQDVAYLRELATEQPFGVDTKLNLSCPYCYCEFDIELPLEASFFSPRQRRKNQENP